MKKVLFGLSLLALTSAAFAESRSDAKAETPAKSETKTQALMYWFDAVSGEYIGRLEDSGCNHADNEPCANGYTTVANPSNPVEPTTPPAVIERGKR